MSGVEADEKLQAGREKLKTGSRASILAAVADFEAAAALGSGAAHAHLAGLLAAGVSAAADWDRSILLLARGADLGFAPAHEELRILARTPQALSPEALRARIDIRALVAPRPIATVRPAPRLRVASALFSPDECGWIIARARDRLARATVYANATAANVVVDERSNREAVFGPGDLDVTTTLLRARLANTIRAPSHLFEPAIVLHYAVGQQFAPHFDFLDPATPGHAADLAQRGQRVATALVYLNDGFEGGETDFPALGWKFRGRPGDLLVFDNVDHAGTIDRRTLHAGSPPTAGEKWLLSQWIRNRPQG